VGLAVLAGGALGGVARSITDGMFVQYFLLFSKQVFFFNLLAYEISSDGFHTMFQINALEF
jgi:hypothetical protein